MGGGTLDDAFGDPEGARLGDSGMKMDETYESRRLNVFMVGLI